MHCGKTAGNNSQTLLVCCLTCACKLARLVQLAVRPSGRRARTTSSALPLRCLPKSRSGHPRTSLSGAARRGRNLQQNQPKYHKTGFRPAFSPQHESVFHKSLRRFSKDCCVAQFQAPIKACFFPYPFPRSFNAIIMALTLKGGPPQDPQESF